MGKNFTRISVICIGINILTILLVLILQKHLPPLVPLYYGLPVSKSQLTPPLGLTIPALTSTAIIIINWALLKIAKDQFIEKILSGICIATTILSLITTINIFATVGKI